MPWLHFRHGRSRVQEQARTRQPLGAAAHVPDRQQVADRRRQEGLRKTNMAEFKEISPNASTGEKLTNWFENRLPSAFEAYRIHMSENYAPKNFNFWYIFGSLAMLVLVIQIVTGIFLTMHYKPDAAKAFESVEYIMRDVPWGWLIRYMHSTGASAFFVVVYLHMFRGLLYGSYRKPRELVWIFGCAIFLA